MEYKDFKNNYSQAFPGSSTNEIRQSHAMYNTLIGGGGGLEFITDPAKRTELIDQLKLGLIGFSKGYGITGILGWAGHVWNQRFNKGQNDGIYQMVVPLSSLILWHPVRGPGERGAAGAKTTDRKNVVLNGILQGEISYTRKKPFNSLQWNTMPIMRSTEEIQTVPVHFVNEDARIQSSKMVLNELAGRIQTASKQLTKRILQVEYNKKMDLLNTLLKQKEVHPGFLIMAGQGRIQGVVEAVREAQELGYDINPDDFWIKIDVGDIPVEGCNILLDIHNYYIQSGMFGDDRHKVWANGRYVTISETPIAFSCRKNTSVKDLPCYTKYDRSAYKNYSLKAYHPCTA
jgi:hypothetical protein